MYIVNDTMTDKPNKPDKKTKNEQIGDDKQPTSSTENDLPYTIDSILPQNNENTTLISSNESNESIRDSHQFTRSYAFHENVGSILYERDGSWVFGVGFPFGSEDKIKNNKPTSSIQQKQQDPSTTTKSAVKQQSISILEEFDPLLAKMACEQIFAPSASTNYKLEDLVSSNEDTNNEKQKEPARCNNLMDSDDSDDNNTSGTTSNILAPIQTWLNNTIPDKKVDNTELTRVLEDQDRQNVHEDEDENSTKNIVDEALHKTKL